MVVVNRSPQEVEVAAAAGRADSPTFSDGGDSGSGGEHTSAQRGEQRDRAVGGQRHRMGVWSSYVGGALRKPISTCPVYHTLCMGESVQLHESQYLGLCLQEPLRVRMPLPAALSARTIPILEAEYDKCTVHTVQHTQYCTFGVRAPTRPLAVWVIRPIKVHHAAEPSVIGVRL